LYVWGCVWAQSQNSHSERLPWVKGQFPEKKGNFEYMVARGSGSTIAEARENALNDLLIDLGNNAGVSVNSSTISEIKSQMNFDGRKTDYSEDNTSVSTFKIEREGFNASFSKASEYYERSRTGYELWALYEVSKSGASFKPYIPEYTDQYGMRAAWRSAIIPGWGQFHKGKTGKGIFFLSAEVAAVSSAIFFETKRSDNVRKSQEATNLDIVKEYRNRADNWELYRNIAIGTAAGVYVWNVLDAGLSKGKIRYAWIPDNLHLTTSNYNDMCFYGVGINF